MSDYQPGYQGLVVRQRAMDLAEAVYRASAGFPPDERYGLTGQLRRAIVSIPANIAEGRGKSSRADYVRFLEIARGSLYESETLLQLAARIGIINREALDGLLALSGEIGRLLNGLIRAQRQASARSDS